MPYETSLTVHFGDVDPAQIVYYPNIFHYCHLAFEQFFAEYVGLPYARLLNEERLGFPAVSAQADFHKRIKYGAEIRMLIDIPRIGNKSVTFHYQGLDENGEKYFDATIIVVTVHMDDFTPLPLPEKYRAIFEKLVS